MAGDCPVDAAMAPPEKKSGKTIANLQYEMLIKNPYRYTSDEVLFDIYAFRNQIRVDELERVRKSFFAKGQPCFRASPLPKSYGWGVHFDLKGRMALTAVESEEYARLSADKKVRCIKALSSKRS